MGEVIDQWANIHQDMLNEIAKRIHSYDDYLQLRLVCKQWNFRVPKIPNNKVPWLLLPVEEEEDIFYDTPSLEEKGIHYLTLPDMQHKLIRGSCYGWLIVVSIEGTIRMLNPWTKVCFDLPPISSLPNVTCNSNECTYYLGPHEVMTDTVDANKFLVWKVIINSAFTNDDDFLAVAIYTGLRLVFYKPNNKTWLEIPGNGTYPYFQDVIFFEEKIYAIDDDGQLYEFDAKTSAEPVGGIHEATPPSDIVTLGEILNIKYLIVRDDGSLLMIVRHRNLRDGQENYRYYDTIKFDIYELKKNSKAWSRIISLGNYVLIVGFNASVRMWAGEFLNCKGNQVYFTDNFVAEQTMDSDQDYYHGIGVFDLEDESCQTVLSDVKFSCPPAWIFP
ncbi:hypothetical protein PIB30_049749 [Stylosanthes scabra]|uniref:KIB1-4 beta-propeller domain-containing protein n=1 Tax=Stylosanthes scabra TaxID=79078 RepID=A0ABU6VH40_9FABA|nr:hypothetical protein [Stylosanthes scabra]